MSTVEPEWTTVIKPQARWLDLRLGELWRYRDLVTLFVHRDFVARYKQTVLGLLWYVIQPILTTVVFTVVFGNIAGLSTDGLPKFLFYMAGTVTWSYFADCLNKTHNIFTVNANIFGKAYFPRLAVPVSILISNLVTFAVQLALLLGFICYFILDGSEIRITSTLFLLPILILLMAGLGLGLGLTISAMTTRYRDLSNLVTFGVSLMMYTTPVIYPISAVPERYRTLLLANPMTPIIETMRAALLGRGEVSALHLTYCAAVTLLILFSGLIVFNRVERTFMDSV